MGFVKDSVLSRELFSLISRKEENSLDVLLRKEGGKDLSVCSGCTAVKAGQEVWAKAGQRSPFQTRK